MCFIPAYSCWSVPPVDNRPCRKKTGKCLLIILELLPLHDKADIRVSFTLQPLRGISIIKQAIDKMQMNTNQLTSVHADLCQVSQLLDLRAARMSFGVLKYLLLCNSRNISSKHLLKITPTHPGHPIYTLRIKVFDLC